MLLNFIVLPSAEDSLMNLPNMEKSLTRQRLLMMCICFPRTRNARITLREGEHNQKVHDYISTQSPSTNTNSLPDLRIRGWLYVPGMDLSVGRVGLKPPTVRNSMETRGETLEEEEQKKEGRERIRGPEEEGKRAPHTTVLASVTDRCPRQKHMMCICELAPKCINGRIMLGLLSMATI